MLKKCFIKKYINQNLCKAYVVYFDQRLVAAHTKCWFKYAFSMFFVLNDEIAKKGINLLQN